MADKKTRKKSDIRKMRKTARRVFLDPSTPPASSIIRVISISLVVLLLTALVLILLYELSFLLFLIVLSIFFAYLLEPLVKIIRQPFKVRNLEKFMPRSLAIAVSYLLVFSILAIAISYLAPLIAAQIQEFANNSPNYAQLIQERIAEANTRYSQMIPESFQVQIYENIGSFLQAFGVWLTGFIGLVAVSIATYFPWLLLIPILAFFFLKDVYLYRSLFLRCFPSGRWRARVESVLRDVNQTLAAYARAQLISCLLIGTVCTIAFTLIGLDYALLLGILAGVFEFIPLLGPLTISLIAVLVGLFSDNPWDALWTAIFMTSLRLTHDYVTYPRIVRDGIHLHPLAIILSVLAGEQIGGIPGVFFSIPVVAILTVLYKHILAYSGREGFVSTIIDSIEKDETKAEVIEKEDVKDSGEKEI
ncbi:MAG: AI-2E family transporter [Aridibacter sp.]